MPDLTALNRIKNMMHRFTHRFGQAEPPTHGTELDPGLLDRYWFGGASPQEIAAVEAWFHAHPTQHAWYQQLHHGLLEQAHAPAMVSADVHETIAAVLTATNRRTSRPNIVRQSVRPRWALLVGITVGVAVLIAGWSLAHTVRHTTPITHPTIYATANGERATVTLADGTQVMLNVGSRLQVSPEYGRQNRSVQLSGEALFTVAHQGALPFIVHAGSSTTRVLGTSFVVRHYATDSTVTIAVRDGRVAVLSSVVSSGQMVHVGATGVSPIAPVGRAPFMFASGVLWLDDMPLRVAITDLDRWYDADIHLGDQRLATRSIGGQFGSGSLADLSEILTGTLRVRVVREGRTLTLYSR